MSSFRTEWHPTAAESPRSISHSDRIVTIGSCFAENVAARLRGAMMQVTSNPLGTMFNPASIHSCIARLCERRRFTEADLVEHQGWLHTFDTHSSLSSSAGPEQALERLNEAVEMGSQALVEADTLILTLGTAWVFSLAGTDRIVANCHKLPASRFDRTRLSVGQTAEYIASAARLVRGINPEVKIFITVSPVRHLADGLHGNQLSKSTLQLGADIAAGECGLHYFPAYELLCDDLRDYRFYAADMLHPSDTAIDYIYGHFLSTCFTPAGAAAARECEALSRRLAHRINPDTPPAIKEKFITDTETLRANLIKKYPYLQCQPTQQPK